MPPPLSFLRPNDTLLRDFGTTEKQTAFDDIKNGLKKYAQDVMDDLRCYGITLNELNVALAMIFLSRLSVTGTIC